MFGGISKKSSAPVKDKMIEVKRFKVNPVLLPWKFQADRKIMQEDSDDENSEDQSPALVFIISQNMAH